MRIYESRITKTQETANRSCPSFKKIKISRDSFHKNVKKSLPAIAEKLFINNKNYAPHPEKFQNISGIYFQHLAMK